MQSSLSTARGNEARISHSESSENLNLFVKDLLDQMKSQVSNVGNSIQGRMDEMGERLGDLEQNISNLMYEAGLDESEANPSSHKSNKAYSEVM